MAVDSKTQKDVSSPLKSVSWSETTVAQVDDRCVQIPVDEFKTLLSGEGLPADDLDKLKTFEGVDTKDLSDNSESEMYRPLCDIFNAVEELAGSKFRWKVVANHGESADIDHKPDLARYPIDNPDAEEAFSRDMEKLASDIARCAWAWMNSYVEVKNAERKSPFFFAPNFDKLGIQKLLRQGEVGKKARGQFIKYLTEAFLRQHRTHYFSFYITEMYVRVFRWDRVGCIASEPINLRERPEDFLDILYRLATSPDQGGVDNTAELATTEEIDLLREYDAGGNKYLGDYHESMLNDLPSFPIYKVSCPTVSLDGSEVETVEKTYLIGRYAFGHYSPVGRCTRGYPAFDMDTKRLVWFKDQWRCSARPHTELDAYIRLHKHNVSYIATPVAGGDVEGHRTLTQDYLTHLVDAWRPSERVHTRLVTHEVGRLLETYRDSWELLLFCTHAFCAHQQAWETARILHRDISVGNIMINVETDMGFLNDWDLCKYREDMEAKLPASEPSGISGTWAFKSALALRYPRKPPELADDLESFIHVVTFLGYRFHDHELSSEPVDNTEHAQILANADNPELMGLVSVFFYAQKRVGNGFYKGGGLKYHMVLSGLPPVPFRPLKNGKRSLVESFLVKAYQLLQEHYWSLDESEFAEYAAHDGDCASPDEIDNVTTVATVPPTDGPAQYLGQNPVYATILAMNASRTVKSSKGKEVFWKTMVRKKPTCPFDDPQPVLESHTDLAWLFVSVARDEHGNDLDLKDYRDDKLFDQFLSWRMICYLNRKGKTGQWKGDSSSAESAAKRKRPEDDTGEEASTPPKKPATRRTRGRATKALVNAEEKPPAKGKSKANGKTAASKKAPASRAAPKKAAKSQLTKTATKASASRKAQVTRKPASPRRPAAVKAAVTGKGRGSKAKTEPSAPVRRSARLANKA